VIHEWLRCDSLITRAAKITSTLELDGSVSGGATFDNIVVNDSSRNEGTLRQKGESTFGATATPVVISTAGKLTAADSIVTSTGIRSDGLIYGKDDLTVENDVTINPTVTDQEDPTFTLNWDRDYDASEIAAGYFKISGTPNATPANSTINFTTTGVQYVWDKGFQVPNTWRLRSGFSDGIGVSGGNTTIYADNFTGTCNINLNIGSYAAGVDGEIRLGDTGTAGEYSRVDSLGILTVPDTLYLHNDTHEDGDGGRESQLRWTGEQTGGEVSTLAMIQASHDGTSDDEKGDLIFYTNDGDDGISPTERLKIDGDGDLTVVGDIKSTGGVGAFGSWGYTGEHIIIPEASSNTNAGLGMYGMVNYEASAGKVFAGTYSRALAMTANQTNQATIVGTESQFRLRDVNIADGVHAGLWAYAEQSGTSTLSGGGTFDAISATIESESGFSAGATEHVTGLTLDSSINGSATINASTNFSAIYVKSNGKDWYYGTKYTGIATAEILGVNGETWENITTDGIWTTDGGITASGALSASNYGATNKLTACATNAGALDYSAASKTLTVEDDAVVSQDYSSDASPTFAGVDLGANGGTSGNIDFIASDNDQGDIDISTDDELEIKNFSGGVQFDAQLHGNIEYDKISIGLDDAHAMASDTLWFFENDFQVAMTLDSIRVRATTDDQDVNVIKSARNGGSIAVVDAITASTDGLGEVYYQTETTLTTSSIAAGEYIGITKPTAESDNIAISIYYHVTKQKR